MEKHNEQGKDNQKQRTHHFLGLVDQKVADGVHVAGATLDDIAGLVFGIPGIGQFLNVIKQPVTQPFDVFSVPWAIASRAPKLNSPEKSEKRRAASAHTSKFCLNASRPPHDSSRETRAPGNEKGSSPNTESTVIRNTCGVR